MLKLNFVPLFAKFYLGFVDNIINHIYKYAILLGVGLLVFYIGTFKIRE